MQACWRVDHNDRPTFGQLVPELQSLLNDSHKQVHNDVFLLLVLVFFNEYSQISNSQIQHANSSTTRC